MRGAIQEALAAGSGGGKIQFKFSILLCIPNPPAAGLRVFACYAARRQQCFGVKWHRRGATRQTLPGTIIWDALHWQARGPHPTVHLQGFPNHAEAQAFIPRVS